MRYSTEHILPWMLSDGTEVLLRPIEQEDRHLEYEMLTTISEETAMGRFFRPVKVTREMVEGFYGGVHETGVAVLAEVLEGDRRKMAGVGRLVLDPDLRGGEFAVIVHDRYQGRGLGRKLMETLVEMGRERGLKVIHGTVLAENRRMLKLCEKLGFTIKRYFDFTCRAELVLD